MQMRRTSDREGTRGYLGPRHLLTIGVNIGATRRLSGATRRRQTSVGAAMEKILRCGSRKLKIKHRRNGFDSEKQIVDSSSTSDFNCDRELLSSCRAKSTTTAASKRSDQARIGRVQAQYRAFLELQMNSIAKFVSCNVVKNTRSLPTVRQFKISHNAIEYEPKRFIGSATVHSTRRESADIRYRLLSTHLLSTSIARSTNDCY